MVSVRDAKNKALFVRNFVTISKTAGDNLPAAKLRTHSHRIFTKRSHAPRRAPTHLRAPHAPAPLRNFARVRPSPSAAEGEHGGASTEARNAEGTKRPRTPRVPIHAISSAACACSPAQLRARAPPSYAELFHVKQFAAKKEERVREEGAGRQDEKQKRGDEDKDKDKDKDKDRDRANARVERVCRKCFT